MNKIPKGWTVTEGQMTLQGKLCVVYQARSKRLNISKTFISWEAMDRYFKQLEYEKTAKQALAGKGAPSPSKGAILMATKDIVAANELGEYAV